MTAFAQWLAGTSASMVVQKTLWLIPLMQTIHIICVALVFSSVVMIEFRVLGYSKAGTVADTARRFVPWIYACVALMALTGAVLIVGEPERSLPSFEFQMKMLLALTVSFNLITLLIAYSTVVEEVRWNETGIQRRTWLFSRRAMAWRQLAAFGVEMSGYWWIRSYDGPKIRFSPYSNGFDQLVRKIADNLPTDLPPAEADLIAEAVLARAR